jgi:hypothetical protein
LRKKLITATQKLTAFVRCARCTNDDRSVSPFANEDALDRMAERLKGRPQVLDRRCEIVEHPFGCIEQWINPGAFPMRGLENVRAKFGLTALVHNLHRALSFLGVGPTGLRGRRPPPRGQAALGSTVAPKKKPKRPPPECATPSAQSVSAWSVKYVTKIDAISYASQNVFLVKMNSVCPAFCDPTLIGSLRRFWRSGCGSQGAPAAVGRFSREAQGQVQAWLSNS